MGKRAETLQAVFDLLQDCGWMPDGTTREETVRLPSSKNLIGNDGKSGGELVTFGSRQRFRKFDWFCTAGPRTVNFYRRGSDGPIDFHQAKSSDLEGVRKLATEKGTA